MKKKALSLLVTFAMLFSMFPATTLAAETDGVAGSEDLASNDYYEFDDVLGSGETPMLLSTGTDTSYVAYVGETGYTDIQEAIKAAAPDGTVELKADVTVEEWVMFTETLTIGNDNLITLDSIDGLTIDGNRHTLTINSIESAGNGGRLFYDATELNIKDLTIKYADGVAGGIGLTSGTISNVTFDGGVYGVLPGAGEVTIEDCTFKTNGTSIYFEDERDNLVVTGNTFENEGDANVILLRGDVTFTGNTIMSGRTVNVVSGSPVVSENNFNDVRFKVYNAATATIVDNYINVLEFNDDAAEVCSSFAENTLSEAAQAKLDAAKWAAPSQENPVIGNLAQLKAFRDAVNNGETYKGVTIKLVGDIDLDGEEWTPIGNSTHKFQGTFDGDGHTISNLVITGNNSNVGLFGFTTDGEIKNLTVENAQVSGRLNVGVVAGTPYTSKYTNIKVTSHVEVNGMSYVGGVGGKNAYANWTDITVDVDDTSYVKATSTENGTAYRTYVGGVIGFMGEGGHGLTNVTCNIDVTGDVCDVGGIVGIAHYQNTFTNCTYTGIVTNTNSDAADVLETGLIAGVWHNNAGGSVTFTNCSADEGTVSTPNADVTLPNGGLIGAAYNTSNDTDSSSGSLIVNGEKKWPEVAEVNGVKYGTLSAAIDAAGEDDVVYLLNDAIEVVEIEDGGTTIDLDGNTITGSILIEDGEFEIKNGSIVNTDSAVSGIEINAGNLTLFGVNVTSARHALRVDGKVTATIDGGTYRGASGTGTGTYHAVNVSGEANVTIADGVFVGPKGTTADSGAAVNVQSGATVVIKGGDFSGGKNNTLASAGTLSVSGGSYDQDVTAYCPVAYQCVKSNVNGKYYVSEDFGANMVAQVNNGIKYQSIDDALAAAKDGDTITLLTDVALDASLTINKSITLDGDGHTISGTASPLLKLNSTANITVQNTTLTATNNVVRWNYANEGYTHTYQNCQISGGVYGIHYDGNGGKIVIDGCTIDGFNAFAGSLAQVTIKDTTFDADNSGYAGANLWGNAVIENVTLVDEGKTTWLDVKTVAEVTGGKVVKDGTEISLESYLDAAAKIGTTYYDTLAGALSAAKDGDIVTLLDDCAEDVTVSQAPDVEITIDGDGKTYSGTITVDGKSARYETAGLTIKNVQFDTTNITKDASINLGGDNNIRYTSNVTVENCSFTGSDNTKVGIKQYTGGCHDLVVTDCTATGMHSLMQLKNVEKGLTVTDCEITDSKNGISIGQSSGVEISGCTINTTGYGIRADGQGAYTAAVENCTISAELPIVIRKTDAAYELTLEGTNILTGSNSEGYQVVFTSGDDGTYEKPADIFTLTSADDLDVFPVYNYVAQIGDTKYETLQDALEALTDGATLTLLADVTVSENWDCRANGAKVTASNVNIDGNGHKLTLTGSVDDKNWNTVFRFEGDNATVKNLTIDASAATGVQRGISSKLSITVDNCTLIGNGTTAKRAIIFGEGAGDAISNVVVAITNSTFIGWSYGVSDNQNGQDAKSVSVTDSTFENASVLVSAAETAVFTGNTMENGWVNITSYSVPNALSVTATGNTLEANTEEEDNSIKAETITTQEGFLTPVAEMGGVYYTSLEKAISKAEAGDTITLLTDITVDADLTIPATLEQNGKTITLAAGVQLTAANAGLDVSTVSGYEIKTSGTEGAYIYTSTKKASGGSGSSGGGSYNPSYTITAEDTENGNITVSPSRASKGTTVTITADPNSGYELDELTVLDKNGDEVKLTKKSDTKYTFTMPSGKVTIEATFAEIAAFENPFVDVAEGKYYYDAVLWAAENGITGGTTATTFSPAVTCTRAQTVTFLWRAAGSPEPESTVMPFTDVVEGSYYYDAVLWAVENGITSGTSATTFSPNATVTRAQNVTFLWRWAESPAAEQANPFTDVAEGKYYHDAVIWAAEQGITSGTTATTFSPDDPCLRSQIVTFLYRYLAD